MSNHDTVIPFEAEPVDDLPQLLTAEEAARRLRCSTRKVYQMLADRELPPVYLGRSVRVSRAALARYIARQEAQGGA